MWYRVSTAAVHGTEREKSSKADTFSFFFVLRLYPSNRKTMGKI